ncbi:MAG: hypothetical protein QME96_06190 [Myxococcota bacterium]|nr:hypothetical protein [Myxococcota bacterium]
MRKRSRVPLVCQHLEKISGSALETPLVQVVLRERIGRRNGIYALYRGKRLYYVGLATNLRSRLRSHLRDRHAGTWDRFSLYLTDGDRHLREIESLVLRISDPKGNRVWGALPGAKDLRREFRRAIVRAQRDELDEVLGEETGKEPGIKRSAAARQAWATRRGSSRRKGGREPTLARYVKRRFHIRWDYKGKRFVAHVRRDGTIRFSPRESTARTPKGVFTSPSKAAAAAAGKRAYNGWSAWRYERAPDEWVLLDALRKS